MRLSDATQCEFSNGRGWTLVYKISRNSRMQTTGEENVDALLSLMSTPDAGKMSDQAIKELCAGQYRVDQFNGYGSRMAYNPIYCHFDDVSEYADYSRSAKRCSRWFDSAGSCACFLPNVSP